ncbi:MAG: hypothetical protein ACK559_11630, partial [bacterium]
MGSPPKGGRLVKRSSLDMGRRTTPLKEWANTCAEAGGLQPAGDGCWNWAAAPIGDGDGEMAGET